MEIAIKIDNLRGEIAPLYFRYPREINPQPAYVEMDEHGEVTADSTGEIGGAIPFSVFHGRTRRYGVASAVKGDALADYLESGDARALFQRIYDGHSVEWDGNNNMGRLTEDAQQAEIDLEAALIEIDQAEVYEAAQWIENDDLDNLWKPGVSLADAAKALEVDARDNQIELDGDVEKALLNLAQHRNDQGTCYRTDILDALVANGRHPVDENGDEWLPTSEAAASQKAESEEPHAS